MPKITKQVLRCDECHIKIRLNQWAFVSLRNLYTLSHADEVERWSKQLKNCLWLPTCWHYWHFFFAHEIHEKHERKKNKSESSFWSAVTSGIPRGTAFLDCAFKSGTTKPIKGTKKFNWMFAFASQRADTYWHFFFAHEIHEKHERKNKSESSFWSAVTSTVGRRARHRFSWLCLQGWNHKIHKRHKKGCPATA